MSDKQIDGLKCFINATIVDGSGVEPFLGAVLVEGDRIVRVVRQTDIWQPENVASWQPKFAELTADHLAHWKLIDARDKVLCPGFIDAHSHNDWFCLRETKELFFESFIRQGITTMVMGNCGFSASGFNSDSPHLKDLGGELFALKESDKYGDFIDWFAEVSQNVPLNVASLAGHGTARLSVAGMQAQELSPEQETEMLRILEDSLKAGAAGISLGLMYAPGLFAPESELHKVAELCARYDRILTVHPRAESAVSLNFAKHGRSHLLQALDELADLTRKTGCRFEYSHLIFVGRKSWKDVDEALEILEALERDGFEVGFDMYPYDFGASVITIILPTWYQAMSREARRKPWVRLALRGMIAVTVKLLGFGFEDIRLAYAGEKHPEYNGRLISEIAASEGRSSFDVYLSVCEDSDFKARVLMSSYQNDEIMDRLMRHPMSVFMTDAWVEEAGVQNESIYNAFPRFLRLAREKRISLEAVIHKMTGLTAERFQLAKRGYVREGYFADLVLFDPQTVSDIPVTLLNVSDSADSDSSEATSGVLGIEGVYVNGVEQTQDLDLGAGQVIRVN